MLRKIPVLLAALVLLHPAAGNAGLFAPSNYDECITETMRGVSSDIAARAIIESCRNLFPKAPSEEPAPAAPAPSPAPAAAPAPLESAAARNLTADELARLSYKAKIFGSTYRVTVENDNPGLTLTEVTIAVWDNGSPVTSRNEYRQTVQIEPGTTAEVKYEVHYRGEETSWDWALVAARGVQSAAASVR